MRSQDRRKWPRPPRRTLRLFVPEPEYELRVRIPEETRKRLIENLAKIVARQLYDERYAKRDQELAQLRADTENLSRKLDELAADVRFWICETGRADDDGMPVRPALFAGEPWYPPQAFEPEEAETTA